MSTLALPFVCLGVSHQNTPVDIREKIAIKEHRLQDAILSLRKSPLISEMAILSTCNRLELYAATRHSSSLLDLQNFLYDFHAIPKGILDSHVYTYTGLDAARQLFRVAASLDALIIGEPQILGQVKDAYQKAKSHGALGPVLHRIFDNAFRTAKRIRTETKLAHNAVNISHAAVLLAEQIFGNLNKRHVTLIGTGEMNVLSAKYLHSKGAQILILNRSVDNAIKLAKRHQARFADLKHIEEALLTSDVVITSTSAESFVIKQSMLQHNMHKRRFRPILLIDISVPRNIDPRIAKIDGVYLYDVDDMQAVVKENLRARHSEVEHAESIINQELQRLSSALKYQESAPFITALKTHTHAVMQTEIYGLLKSLQIPMNDEVKNRVEESIHSMNNKVLHRPIHYLKSSLENSQTEGQLEAAHKSFLVDKSRNGDKEAK